MVNRTSHSFTISTVRPKSSIQRIDRLLHFMMGIGGELCHRLIFFEDFLDDLGFEGYGKALFHYDPPPLKPNVQWPDYMGTLYTDGGAEHHTSDNGASASKVSPPPITRPSSSVNRTGTAPRSRPIPPQHIQPFDDNDDLPF